MNGCGLLTGEVIPLESFYELLCLDVIKYVSMC